MSEAQNDLVLRGTRISTDAKGNVCLNDLWKIAGEPDNKRARDWRRYAGTKGLMSALVRRFVGDAHNSTDEAEATLFYSTGRGAAAKTFAHPVLALAYAEVLNEDLGIEVRETFLRYRANDVALALEIIEGLSEQAEYDELRVKLRQLVKDHNKMSAGVAKEAGVTNFEAYNGAGLSGLYGGITKAQLLKHKGLPDDAYRLEHAGHEELAANYFKATQSIAKLKREKIKGQAAANEAHRQVGEAVRETIKGLGGTMPEDEPALEHIREAEKRLKNAAQQQEPTILPSKPSTIQPESLTAAAHEIHKVDAGSARALKKAAAAKATNPTSTRSSGKKK